MGKLGLLPNGVKGGSAFLGTKILRTLYEEHGARVCEQELVPPFGGKRDAMTMIQCSTLFANRLS